ncbi:MAG: hypothetical protein ABIK28_19995 [Planctomycetota bacterium]
MGVRFIPKARQPAQCLGFLFGGWVTRRLRGIVLLFPHRIQPIWQPLIGFVRASSLQWGGSLIRSC